MKSDHLRKLFASSNGLVLSPSSRASISHLVSEKIMLEKMLAEIDSQADANNKLICEALFCGNSTDELMEISRVITCKSSIIRNRLHQKDNFIVGLTDELLLDEWWLEDCPTLGIVTFYPEPKGVSALLKMCQENGWEALNLGPGMSLCQYENRHLVICSLPASGIPVVGVANNFHSAIISCDCIGDDVF